MVGRPTRRLGATRNLMNDSLLNRLGATTVIAVVTLLGVALGGALTVVLVELLVFGPDGLKGSARSVWLEPGDLHLTIAVPVMVVFGVLGAWFGAWIATRARLVSGAGAARVIRRGPF